MRRFIYFKDIDDRGVLIALDKIVAVVENRTDESTMLQIKVEGIEEKLHIEGDLYEFSQCIEELQKNSIAVYDYDQFVFYFRKR